MDSGCDDEFVNVVVMMGKLVNSGPTDDSSIIIDKRLLYLYHTLKTTSKSKQTFSKWRPRMVRQSEAQKFSITQGVHSHNLFLWSMYTTTSS